MMISGGGGAEGRPATVPKRVSLCNKTNFKIKQNMKQKNQLQVSSQQLIGW